MVRQAYHLILITPALNLSRSLVETATLRDLEHVSTVLGRGFNTGTPA